MREVDSASPAFGFNSIKRITGKRHGAPPVEGARIATRHLPKHVAKTFDSEDLGGRHRYGVGQGFQPTSTRHAT